MSDIYWVSLDPVRRKVDFYPRLIAKKIEKAYIDRDTNTTTACVLGSDFFNATIYFHPGGNLYQKTPGLSMGRAGYKQPGYRSVNRIIVSEDKRYKIYARNVHGELRICRLEINSERTFDGPIPPECIITSDYVNVDLPQVMHWKPEDLDSDSLDTNVIVWQWCRGVYEKDGNLMALGNDWWIPYLYEQNLEINEAFTNNQVNVKIKIPVNNTERIIEFKPNSCFASQYDYINHKVRLVRRLIITIQELRSMIDKMGSPPPDPSVLTNIMDPNNIPPEFFCCISQDVMTDPVKTMDGHTYDRASIERWLSDHSTSPLTGLNLPSKDIIPNTTLRDIILEFTLQKMSLTNTNTNTQVNVAVQP